MKTVSLLAFRRNAKQVLKWVQQGQQMVMTYRGKPVARLDPIGSHRRPSVDPFLGLVGLSKRSRGKSVSNAEIDKIVYGI
jgi:prevent-host-death family protein